jgi:hypothetical protein
MYLVPSNSNKQKNFLKNLIFVGFLKVNDENSRIRIRIRIHNKMSKIRNTGEKYGYLVAAKVIYTA